jgi:hypothetical protein
MLTVFVFRRLTDAVTLRSVVNRILAHLLEFRLFLDEPLIVLRAQRDLARENFHLLRMMALPCAILAIPFMFLVVQLDGFYEHAPLPLGQPAVVTAQMKGVIGETPSLKLPAGIAVETPGVRARNSRQVSWRVRPKADSWGSLEIGYQGRVLRTSVAAGSGFHSLTAERMFSDPAISRIEIRYPDATILGMHWLVWFGFVSAAAALGTLCLD